MFKRFQFALLAAAFGLVFVSCQSGNQDIKDAARSNIETQTVQPANPTTTLDQNPQVAAPTGPTTTIEFAESTYDFGSIPEGEIVTHTYSFTNTGSEPLIISDAKGSCGCTVPKKPTAPIAPGETGEIVVEFNSKNKRGKRNQKVTLTANTNPPQTFLYLTGEVQGDGAATTPSIQVQ